VWGRERKFSSRPNVKEEKVWLRETKSKLDHRIYELNSMHMFSDFDHIEAAVLRIPVCRRQCEHSVRIFGPPHSYMQFEYVQYPT